MDISPLTKLGLTDKDIQIYLCLLRKGSRTATQIAKETSQNRSHVYDKIKVLMEKGLISYNIKNNIRYYQASKPEKLLDFVQEVHRDINKILPDLNKIRAKSDSKTEVELYQGKEGMKTVFKDVIREKKNYYVLGEEGRFQELLPIYVQQFLRDVKLNKITEHLLSKESKRNKIIAASEKTKIKYLADKYFSPVMTAMYGDKTAIFIWSDPLFTILIKDKAVSKSFRNYFNLLWEVARE